MSYNNPSDEVLAEVKTKMNKFSEILQNFGLNLIQSIGEMKHQLGILTEKVDKIEKEIISMKSINKNLQGIERSREELLGESHKILSQISNLNAKMDLKSPGSTLQSKIKPNFKNTTEVFDYFTLQSRKATTASDLTEIFKEIKESLFMLTGGHKILFEIREFERKIKPGLNLEDSGLREILMQKIEEWQLKLSSN